MSGETSLGHLGGGRWIGVLLLDVSVKMEIIDFLLPQTKQKLFKNIIITPQKCVKGIDYVQPLLQFMRVKLGACFDFTLDTAIKTAIRGSVLRFTFFKGGGRGQGDFLWTKSIRSKFSNVILMSASLI